MIDTILLGVTVTLTTGPLAGQTAEIVSAYLKNGGLWYTLSMEDGTLAEATSECFRLAPMDNEEEEAIG